MPSDPVILTFEVAVKRLRFVPVNAGLIRLPKPAVIVTVELEKFVKPLT